MIRWILWTAPDPMHCQGVTEPEGELLLSAFFYLRFFLKKPKYVSSSDLFFLKKEETCAGFKGTPGGKDAVELWIKPGGG